MRIFFVAVALASLWTPMLAQEGTQRPKSEAPLMVSFADLKWVELPERNTQIRKVPAGTDNPLHSHSSEIKNVIISGVWYTGPNAASAKDFGPGSVVIMPADWLHVSGCRAGSDCVFYQEGKGKFDFKSAAEQRPK